MSAPARQPIRSGMFIMPFHPPSKPLAQSLDEDLELIVRAEELGFAEFWIGEHHTMKYEPIVMPEIFRRFAYFNNASACWRAAPVWPPSIRASSVTRDFLSSRVISEIVRPFLTCLVTT